MLRPISKKYTNLAQLGNITTPYGGKTRSEPFHKGVDIANKSGTPIPNMADGVVVSAKTGMGKGSPDNSGNQVVIKDGQGNTHMYSHLRDVLVKPGQKVSKNQKIATMGDSGNTYSPTGGDASHLDYRVADAYGRYRDPSKIIKK